MHPTFDTAFYKIVNVIGERACDKVLLFVASKFCDLI